MGRSSKDKRDIFYRLAKEEGWRARSAFKLLQIHQQFGILNSPVTRAVDLCAAPGSWSQVLSQTLGDREGASIVAVDLQAMAPIPGVTILQGDITAEATATQIIARLGHAKADIVVCDGAPDVTGLHHLDEYLQAQLLLSALNIATCVLEPGGSFVAKMFRSSKSGVEALIARVSIFFGDVVIAKPRSSRASSIESFIVARKFTLPPGYTPTLSSKDKGENENSPFIWSTATSPQQRLIIPFLTCGDLRGFDGDTSYPLPEDYSYKDPVQVPIAPAYAEAVRRRRGVYAKLALPPDTVHRPGTPPPSQDLFVPPPTGPVAGVQDSGGCGDGVMELTLNFGGGAELLVGGSREGKVYLPVGTRMSTLLTWMVGKGGVVKERPELIIQGNDVRPGILVLVNDTDWELVGRTEAILSPGDVITFISTLHGG